ncbi:urease accessory protein UreD [Rubritalea sp.]|uniref:urease accessory protein UreD n=1 Tax=Rubritalea sp. TaxID=2109375 RepID=UPI003EF4A9E9
MLASSIQSKAQLRFKYSEQGERTQLVARRLGGLCHASKPYHDGKHLYLQIVNPTAGLFAGDSLEMDFRLAKDCRVSLTSPSATRFHTMKQGEHADFTQNIEVGENAILDYWPEMVIAQRGSTVHQQTKIQLTESSRMLLLDSLAPGRVAHGEVNAYREYSNAFDLKLGDRLLVRERMTLTPVNGEWQLLAPAWSQCYVASIWCYDKSSLTQYSSFQDEVLAIPTDSSVLCAFSYLGDGLAVVRVLAENAIEFRKTTELVREIALCHIVREALDFRKI